VQEWKTEYTIRRNTFEFKKEREKGSMKEKTLPKETCMPF